MGNLTLLNSSEALLNELTEIHQMAVNSIVAIMKMNNVTEVDFTLDKNGKSNDDEDYDEDWVWDTRVYLDCYGKYSNEVGYVSSVKLVGEGNIEITAEGECGTYPNDYVSNATGVYIDILRRLEEYFPSK